MSKVTFQGNLNIYPEKRPKYEKYFRHGYCSSKGVLSRRLAPAAMQFVAPHPTGTYIHVHVYVYIYMYIHMYDVKDVY